MPKAAPTFGPGQVISPILAALTLILFFIGWVELKINPPESAKKMSKEEIAKTKELLGIDPTKSMSMVSQSGFQIASGKASLGSDLRRLEEKRNEKRKTTSRADRSGQDELDEELKRESDFTAPLLYLYMVAVIAAVVLGFIPWPSMTRKIIIAGVCGLALAVVGLQAVMGFPIDKKIQKEAKKKDEASGMFDMGDRGKDTERVRVAWQIPLYLTFLLLMGATGTAFIGPVRTGGYKGRKRAYDFDDDEDDDRPRRKKRRDDDEDDDDDDDRPRKKKKALSLDDDDEDDRPKRRRHDDDDDDDDRPRKKRRRDDDD